MGSTHQTRLLAIASVVAVVSTACAYAAVAMPSSASPTHARGAPCRVDHVHPSPAPSPTWVKGLESFATEIITVTVKGGPLRVTPSTTRVTLHRTGDVLEGMLGPIDVIDARGTFPGWELIAKANDAAGVVSFLPAVPTVVYGEPEGLTAGPGGVRNAVIACATPDHGGGTYRVTTTIRVRPAHRQDSLDIAVELRAR